MAKGDRYYIYSKVNVYYDSADAINKYDPRSYIDPANASGYEYNNLAGYGTCYIDNFSNWNNFPPAIPIYWVQEGNSSGYNIGWINSEENGFPINIGVSGVPKRAKAVYIGNAINKPVKAIGAWIGGVDNKPKKAK